MADQGAKAPEGPLTRFARLRVPRYVGILLLVLCFGLGYFLASLLPEDTDSTALAEICGRLEALSQLVEEPSQAASQQVRRELDAIIEQCHRVLLDNETN